MSGPKKKLTKKQLKEIYYWYNKAYTIYEIAEKLKISVHYVRVSLRGKRRGMPETLALRAKLRTPKLTEKQEQLILGSLLGDASLSSRIRRKNGPTQYELNFIHCLKQKGYLEYKANILNINSHETVQAKGSFAEGRPKYTASYHNKYELEKIYNITHNKLNIKTVSKKWADKLSPYAIAIWFMDDGSSTYKKSDNIDAKFYTLSFSKKEINLLRDKLLEYGIDTNIQKGSSGKKMNISVKQKSINKLMDLIEPYVNEIKCMRYKIKKRKTSAKLEYINGKRINIS